jgi:hypothetical protein
MVWLPDMDDRFRWGLFFFSRLERPPVGEVRFLYDWDRKGSSSVTAPLGESESIISLVSETNFAWGVDSNGGMIVLPLMI